MASPSSASMPFAEGAARRGFVRATAPAIPSGALRLRAEPGLEPARFDRRSADRATDESISPFVSDGISE